MLPAPTTASMPCRISRPPRLTCKSRTTTASVTACRPFEHISSCVEYVDHRPLCQTTTGRRSQHFAPFVLTLDEVQVNRRRTACLTTCSRGSIKLIDSKTTPRETAAESDRGAADVS